MGNESKNKPKLCISHMHYKTGVAGSGIRPLHQNLLEDNMGWCSGTDLFDKVIDAIPEEHRTVELFKKIITAFEENDWDCQYESKYYDNPMFQEAWDQ